MPLFSVILTASDRPKLLARALRSLFSQTFRDWELILVVDGDCEEVLDVARRLKDTGIVIAKPFDCKVGSSGILAAGEPCPSPVKRVAAAVNLGLDRATGDWITYLCDDDEYLPRRFEKYLPQLDLADAVCGNAQFVQLTGAVAHQGKFRFRYPEPLLPGHAELLEAIRPGNFICHDSIVHKRTHLRWPVDVQPTPNDWRYWLLLHQAGFRFRRALTVGERALMPGAWRGGALTEDQVLALVGEEVRGGSDVKRMRYAKNVTKKKQVVSTTTGRSIVVYPGERIDADLVSYTEANGKTILFPGFALCGDFFFPETLDEMKLGPTITQQRRKPPRAARAPEPPTVEGAAAGKAVEPPEEEAAAPLGSLDITRPRSFEPISKIQGDTLLTAQAAEPKHPFDID